MGEVRTISRKPTCASTRDPQRLYAGEPCTKQFTVQGWKVDVCVKSLFDPSTRLIKARIQEPVRSPGRPGSLQTYAVAVSDSPEARERGGRESNCLR